MGVCALLGLGVPFLLAFWLVKKYKVNPVTILLGAGVFILFALVLESLLHVVVLKGPAGPSIVGNTLYYALYGGLAAGIFEETGRFVAMKWLLRKRSDKALNAIGYGIGHGGIEMLMIFGVTMVSNLVIAIMINTGHSDVLLATVPPESQAMALGQFEGIKAITAGSLLIGFWERISALVLQLGLSMLVWSAVRRGGKWLWFFPATILLHAFVDAMAVLLSKSVSMAALEIIICAIAVAVGAMGWMLGKKLNATE